MTPAHDASYDAAPGDPAYGQVPRARELRHWLRGVRRAHADLTIWRQLEDVYVWLFALILVGAMAGNVVLNLNERTAGGYLPEELQPILVPLVLGTVLRILVGLGPVAASPAAGFWLLATPVNRAALLGPSFVMTTATIAALGPLVALVGWAALGAPWYEVAGAAVLMTALLVATVCLAVLAQRPSSRGWTARKALWLADGLLLVAAVFAIVFAWSSANAFEPPPGAMVITAHAYSWTAPIPGGNSLATPTFLEAFLREPVTRVGLVLTIGVVLLVRRTAHSLQRLSRESVVAGGTVLAGMAGAAAWLDFALVTDIATARHWRQAARVKSRRGAFTGVVALVLREAVRVSRWPRRLVIGFALLLLPYVTAGLGWTDLVPIVAAFAGFAAIRPFGDGLRSVDRSAGLFRALGLSLRTVRLAMAVVPGLLSLMWFALALPVLNEPATAVALALGVLAGVVRYAVAPAPRYDGALVSTPAGAVPPGLFSQPTRGIDVVLVALAPVLFGLSPLIAIVVAGALLGLVLGVVPNRRP